MFDMTVGSGGVRPRDLEAAAANRVLVGTPGTDTTVPHARVRTAESSVAVEVGVHRDDRPSGAQVHVLTGRAQGGVWHDASGAFHAGVEADAKVLGGKTPDRFPVVIDAALLGADARAKVTSQRTEVGASAYVAQGSVTLQHSDPKRTDDGSVRLGAGWGLGGAARVHYDDVDHDGVREYGVGGDIGPISFDVKTEDPLRAVVQGTLPGVGLALPSGNLTEAARHGIDKGIDKLKSLWP